MKNIVIMAFLSAVSIAGVMSQNTPTILAQKHFNLDKGLALEGYDAFSYFKGSKPTKGKSSIQATSDGVVYYFSNDKNKQAFIQNPEKYKPQYGGWCAYAMGVKGEKVAVDPNTFKIVNGKLYLFYNVFFNNTLTSWNEDEASLKNKADNNWKRIFK